MSNDFHMIDTEKDSDHGHLTPYIWGLILSALLTIAAYLSVTEQLFDKWTLISLVFGLAIAQMLVQMFFFLHLGRESKPRWNLSAFLFMALVVLLLVIGSMWIMYSLDIRVMPAQSHRMIKETQ